MSYVFYTKLLVMYTFINRSLIYLLGIAIFTFSTYSTANAVPHLRIKKKVNIQQSQITLDKIAVFKGFSKEDIERLSTWVLAPSPIAGSTQTFPKSYLKLKLKSLDLPKNTRLKLPKKLQVKRGVKVIKHQELVQLIRQEVDQSQLAFGTGIERLEIPKQTDLLLPIGTTLDIQVDPRMLRDRLAISVVITEGSKRISSRRIIAKVSYQKKIVALNRNMRAGEVIQSQDLTTISVPHHQVNRYSILTTIEAIGSKLRKNVSAKVGLSTRWLISKVLVKYGDKVQITFKRNGIFLSAEGQALGQGKRGDMIKVKNIRSRKILTGRIVAPHQIEMEF